MVVIRRRLTAASKPAFPMAITGFSVFLVGSLMTSCASGVIGP